MPADRSFNFSKLMNTVSNSTTLFCGKKSAKSMGTGCCPSRVHHTEEDQGGRQTGLRMPRGGGLCIEYVVMEMPDVMIKYRINASTLSNIQASYSQMNGLKCNGKLQLSIENSLADFKIQGGGIGSQIVHTKGIKRKRKHRCSWPLRRKKLGD